MKRLTLWLALFLSLGFNLGLVVSRLTPERPAETRRDAPEMVDPAASQKPAEESAAEFPNTAAAAESAGNDAATASTDSAPRVPPWLERIVVRVADDLGLQGDERERFFNIQRDFFGRTLQARRRHRQQEAEVRRLLLSNHAERAEVEAALERVVRTQGEVERAFLDHYFAARELLDDTQMRKYQQFLGQLRRTSQELSRRDLARRSEGERPRFRQDSRRRP